MNKVMMKRIYSVGDDQYFVTAEKLIWIGIVSIFFVEFIKYNLGWI